MVTTPPLRGTQRGLEEVVLFCASCGQLADLCQPDCRRMLDACSLEGHFLTVYKTGGDIGEGGNLEVGKSDRERMNERKNITAAQVRERAGDQPHILRTGRKICCSEKVMAGNASHFSFSFPLSARIKGVAGERPCSLWVSQPRPARSLAASVSPQPPEIHKSPALMADPCQNLQNIWGG